MHTKHFILTKQRRGHQVNTSPKMSNMFERNFLENWNVDTSMNTNKNPFSATQFREFCLQNKYCEFDHLYFWDDLILPCLFNYKLSVYYMPWLYEKKEYHNCVKIVWEKVCFNFEFFILSSPYFSIFWMHNYVVFYSLCYKLTSMLSGVGAGAKKGEREAISMY